MRKVNLLLAVDWEKKTFIVDFLLADAKIFQMLNYNNLLSRTSIHWASSTLIVVHAMAWLTRKFIFVKKEERIKKMKIVIKLKVTKKLFVCQKHLWFDCIQIKSIQLTMLKRNGNKKGRNCCPNVFTLHRLFQIKSQLSEYEVFLRIVHSESRMSCIDWKWHNFVCIPIVIDWQFDYKTNKIIVKNKQN